MTARQVLLISLIMFASVSCLKLQSNHLSYDDPTQYLNGLLNQQEKFEEEIEKLNENLENTVFDAAVENDIQAKIAILENGILEQEDGIFTASTKLIPQLVLKDQCQNITEIEKSSIIQKCDKTISDIETLLQKVRALPRDARTIELQASGNNQIYFLKTIKEVLLTNCSTQAILSPTAYQTNIYAPNWITGDQTINDIVNEYVDRSQQYNNITNCPLDRPFYDGTGCINCTDPNPIFNMKTRLCTSCPSGQVLDSNSKVCVQGQAPTPNATNPLALGNSSGNAPNTTNNDVSCPLATPFFNGTACISCSTFFDFNTNKCSSCPNGTIFNSTQRQCAANAPNATNPLALGNSTGNAPNATNNDVSCPLATPFWNGSSCIACAYIFDFSTNQCSQCPSGTTLNSALRQCVSRPANVTNVGSNPNFIGTQPVSSPNDIPCPSATPFFNGSACINCNGSTPIFNITSGQCTQCPTNTTFDNSSHTCLTNKPNGSNPTGANRTIGSLNTSASSPCPAEAPFFNNQSCINCTAPNSFFNATSLQCTNCSNGFYSQNDANCRYFNATNPIANPNVISPNNTQNPNNNVCPIETPYFNGSGCISCNSSSLPYFNQTSGQCANCPNGTLLNSSSGKCENLTPNASNPVASNSSIGNITTAGPQDIPCPVNTPFFINGSCISCPSNTPYLNSTSKQCVNCEGGVYNVTTKSCQAVVNLPYVSNLASKNWVSATPFKDYVETGSAVANGTARACPTATPYFNGASCINCTGSNQYFNVSTSQCVSCPSGTTFRLDSKKCVPPTPIYLTNPNTAPNLIYDTYPQALWKNWYTNNVTAYPEAHDCVTPTPYYNGDHCIACVEPYPYFDLHMLDCVRCPTNYTFRNGQCQNNESNALSPNLASMAATAFTHDQVVMAHMFRHRLN